MSDIALSPIFAASEKELYSVIPAMAKAVALNLARGIGAGSIKENLCHNETLNSSIFAISSA
jgi:hypothetical protein